MPVWHCNIPSLCHAWDQLDSVPLDTIWSNGRLWFHTSAQYRHGPLKWNARSTSCPLQTSLSWSSAWEFQCGTKSLIIEPQFINLALFVSENHCKQLGAETIFTQILLVNFTKKLVFWSRKTEIIFRKTEIVFSCKTYFYFNIFTV